MGDDAALNVTASSLVLSIFRGWMGSGRETIMEEK
jgi:hypothetical protein